MLMSNSLDSRFYNSEINSDVMSQDQNRMRDPQEIIVFFKQEIMQDIEEVYLKARE